MLDCCLVPWQTKHAVVKQGSSATTLLMVFVRLLFLCCLATKCIFFLISVSSSLLRLWSPKSWRQERDTLSNGGLLVWHLSYSVEIKLYFVQALRPLNISQLNCSFSDGFPELSLFLVNENFQDLDAVSFEA